MQSKPQHIVSRTIESILIKAGTMNPDIKGI